jgi:AcrR family transcriptional regulator
VIATGTTQQAATRRQRGRPRQEFPSDEYLARRNEILDIATRVFHEKGYEKGTLEDVAAATGYRKASLYHYVPSKGHLLYLIFDRAITGALQRLQEFSTIGDPARKLEALIRHQAIMVAVEKSLFTVFFDHRPRLEREYEQEIRQKERLYYQVYVDAVADAARAGVIAPVDPHYGAQAVLGMASWVYKWFDPDRHGAEAVAETMCRLLLAP